MKTQKIELTPLTVYNDRYIKTKIRTYGDKVYTNFWDTNVPEDGAECESFTMFYIDSLLVYENKYYLQVYLGSCGYKTVNTQMKNDLDDNLFEFLINGSYNVVLR